MFYSQLRLGRKLTDSSLNVDILWRRSKGYNSENRDSCKGNIVQWLCDQSTLTYWRSKVKTPQFFWSHNFNPISAGGQTCGSIVLHSFTWLEVSLMENDTILTIENKVFGLITMI